MSDEWGDALIPPMLGPATAEPRVSASVRVTNKSCSAKRVQLYFNKWALQKIGSARRCNVYPGTGENEGRLRIVFHEKGAFLVANSRDSRIRVPLFHGVPDRALRPAACKIVTISTSELVIALPFEAWYAQMREKP